MGHEKKQPQEGGAKGAPLWMVTYCDCMTLMLTFFVLLFSFASIDESVLEQLSATFSAAFSGIGLPGEKDKSAFLPTKQIVATEYVDEGSEKPTLIKGSEGTVKEDTEPVDFHSGKVFLTSSKRLFWGKGMAISSEGRNTLSTMASLLKETPGRIVISENSPAGDEDSEQFGLSRAWTVMEYLTTKQGLDKGRFSLAADTLQKDYKTDQQDRSQAKAERRLEIVLLQRSTYN